MTRLQVELASARKRIARAVHKKIDSDDVTVTYDRWNIVVHAWLDSKIIASWYCNPNMTTNQIVQEVRTTEG